MTSTIWIFADADNSLFTTTRECPVPGSIPVAFYDGSPTGWLTPKQAQFLDLLEGRARIVITTARTSEPARTIRLPKGQPDYLICSFGAVIRTPDGKLEPCWHRLIKPQCLRSGSYLKRLDRALGTFCGGTGIDARHHVAEDEGMPLFLSIEHRKRDARQMAFLRDYLAKVLPPDWSVHFNGNFLAALPPHLSKESAVRWFRANIAGSQDLCIGLGDSLSDLGFMRECDMALMPVDSQNFGALLLKPSGE